MGNTHVCFSQRETIAHLGHVLESSSNLAGLISNVEC